MHPMVSTFVPILPQKQQTNKQTNKQTIRPKQTKRQKTNKDETFSMNPEQFCVIYPSYLDSTKTIQEGRRIPKHVAVDTPTVADISCALQRLGIRHVLQPYKGYSRDSTTLWENPGRVKVDQPCTKKKELLYQVAEQIPTIPQRIQRLEHAAQEAAALAEQKAKEEEKQLQLLKQQQQQQQQKQQAQSTVKSTKKKGNKKKR